MAAHCLMRLLRPHWRLLVGAFIALLAESAADLLDPWPLKVILDSVIGSKPVPAWLAVGSIAGHDRLLVLNVSAVAVVAIAVVGAVGSYWENYLSTTVGQRVAHVLRAMLYHHVQRLSLSFYDKLRTGDMVVRLTSDIDSAQDFISSISLSMVFDLITLAGMLGVMLYLDWRFTLIALSVAPILFVVVYRTTRRIRKAARELKERESDLASVVQESISSMRVIKAFAAEAYEEDRFDRESLDNVDTTLRARRIKARLSPSIEIIVAVGTAVVFAVGARFVLSGRLTAGALLVFVLYLGRMYKPMKDLSKMADSLSKSMVALDRIGEVLRTESQVVDVPGARSAGPLRGRIDFEHVTFSYGPDRVILNDVTLAVEPGQSAAVVGPTGSGKSTLIGLIARFYDVGRGLVRVDGRPVSEYTLQSLRSQIAFVLQDTALFHGSVWQNIAYGRPNATRDDVIRAAKVANAHDFIIDLPQGYDTAVAERGNTLSGGQRQRIAIARAIVRNAPILLLDEPSAALDPESESLVFEALSRLMVGRTSITIAHRLATIRRADVIFVLDQGRIVERGTHDQLLSVGGVYARLFHRQFGSDAVPTLAAEAV
jgi:ATP-binding cassette, subfamily B, bacterial